MRILFDTHVLLWAAGDPGRLSDRARSIILDPENSLYFSVATVWEVVIKSRLGRDDFRVDSEKLVRMLLSRDYQSLPIDMAHVLKLQSIPHFHKDPFDRILLAQARSEDMTLMTADRKLLQYGEGVIEA